MERASPVVVVLAGGSNSRFWPLRAKSLLPICGRTLIERHLDGFIAAGCREFVVVASPDTADEMRRAISGLPAEVRVTVQPQPQGMGDALLCAAAEVPGMAARPVIISQAHDVVRPAFYASFIARCTSTAGDGVLAAKRVTSYFPGGYLTLAGDRITGIVEKPGAGSEPSNMVSFVLHWHRHTGELLERIRAEYESPATTDDHYERAVGAMLTARRYNIAPYDGPWQALKYPWHVLGVMEQALQDITPSPNPPEGVRGPVYLEEGVRIFPGGRVVGPAWIGAGTVIGTNSLVRGSVIGRHVEVGFGCEVARSYVGDHCTFHHNYVGDSVIDRNTGLGFGTVTGNWPFYAPPVRSSAGGERLRTELDKFGAVVGADSRTGIGSLLSPGVKIGARTFVGPGVVVTRDIPDGRMILLKQETTDQPNPFR